LFTLQGDEHCEALKYYSDGDHPTSKVSPSSINTLQMLVFSQRKITAVLGLI